MEENTSTPNVSVKLSKAHMWERALPHGNLIKLAVLVNYQEVGGGVKCLDSGVFYMQY